ncbi:MAG: SGNH/GDSL hydrolase family protein [Mycobacteriaceae bacterium]
MPGTRRRHLAAALTAVLLVAGAVVLVGDPNSSAGIVRPPVQPGSTQLVVIGDSLSTGFDTPGDPWTREAPALFAGRGLDVQITNASENGAGYSAPGTNGDLFLDLVDGVVDARAQVVLLFGSDNDLGLPDVAPAMSQTLHRVRALAPRATLIVVGPPSTPANSGEPLLGIRDALASAAAQVGARFVDPITLKWFQGGASRFVAADGEHPNADGEQYLAQQLVDVVAPLTPRRTRAVR